jgi:ribosomal-protein-alanine N-acetyltransferase
VGKVLGNATGNVVFQQASAVHSRDIACLHALLYQEAWTADSVGVLLAHPASVSFIAYANDAAQPAGFLLGQSAADQGEILSLGVRHDVQRCGIGRRLVTAFMDASRNMGVRDIFLEVASGNIAARRLYENLGFVLAGRRSHYYQQPGGDAEDALTLTVVLPPAKAHSR